MLMEAEHGTHAVEPGFEASSKIFIARTLAECLVRGKRTMDRGHPNFTIDENIALAPSPHKKASWNIAPPVVIFCRVLLLDSRTNVVRLYRMSRAPCEPFIFLSAFGTKPTGTNGPH